MLSVLMVFCLSPCIAQTISSPASSRCKGRVEANLHDRALRLKGPNPLHIAVVDNNGQLWRGDLVLRLNPDDALSYQDMHGAELRDFVIPLHNGAADLQVIVLGTNPGLGRLSGDIVGWPSDCSLDLPVNLGFGGHVRLESAPAGLNADNSPIERQAGERPRRFSILFKDMQGKPFELPGDLTLDLTTTLGRFGQDPDSKKPDEWKRSLPVAGSRSNSHSEPIYLKLDRDDAGDGTVDVNVKISGTQIYSTTIDFHVMLNDWALFRWILYGCLSWWVVSFVLDRVKKRSLSWVDVIWSLVAAVVMAFLAFRVDPTRLVTGLVDKTTTRGAFQYGMLVCAVGLDGLLKKIVPQASPTPATPVTVPPETPEPETPKPEPKPETPKPEPRKSAAAPAPPE